MTSSMSSFRGAILALAALWFVGSVCDGWTWALKRLRRGSLEESQCYFDSRSDQTIRFLGYSKEEDKRAIIYQFWNGSWSSPTSFPEESLKPDGYALIACPIK